MSVIEIVWIAVQIGIGYNLILPFIFYLSWLFSKTPAKSALSSRLRDYAVIVTAYGDVGLLPSVVQSILQTNYNNYLVYIVADNCDVSGLHFADPRVILFNPPQVLASNTRSHLYAVERFARAHELITIVDSDNLLHKEYFNELNLKFDEGYQAVQGLRAPKNLEGTIACLDAARDLYYHFYDGKVLFEIGSSATLAGSGMAFETAIYRDFLLANNISGAGFDKVLQSWLLMNNYRIAFSEEAVIYDEKTSKSDQLVQQRSRWINTWFKYFSLGFSILGSGVKSLNRNKAIFGLVLLRPPLFIFLLGAVLCMLVNALLGLYVHLIIWLIAFVLFIASFAIALIHARADARIYRSLVQIPRFVLYQVISLLNVRKANKISVATKHFVANSEKQD
jgi:cellulose synthase/poly-beta-1,6-N-acetylglucosamine synthase-like glycosyltransferase